MRKTFKTPGGSSVLFSSLPYKARKTIQEDSKDYSLAGSFSKMFNSLPEEVNLQYVKEKKIQRTYEQFEKVADRVILHHVNSVYLLNENGEQNLVVYVDNSVIAAELNARRELIKFKYRQEFDIQINNFEIRISRGQYLNNYPFKKKEHRSDRRIEPKELTSDEIDSINQLVSHIEDPELKESFKKVLVTRKQHKNDFLE